MLALPDTQVLIVTQELKLHCTCQCCLYEPWSPQGTNHRSRYEDPVLSESTVSHRESVFQRTKINDPGDCWVNISDSDWVLSLKTAFKGKHSSYSAHELPLPPPLILYPTDFVGSKIMLSPFSLVTGYYSRFMGARRLCYLHKRKLRSQDELLITMCPSATVLRHSFKRTMSMFHCCLLTR